MTAAEPAVGLRERKKRQTRQAILAVAKELFEARGYDQVTVAEIADEANVSVKTLFTYFRSKEDLAFAGESQLRDQLVAAVRSRPEETSAVDAIAAVLTELAATGQDGTERLEGYHRVMGDSDALQSRLRRMWAGYEDALAEVLAEQTDGPDSAPRARLTAMMLVGLIRSLTSPEVLAEVRQHQSQPARRDAVRSWIATGSSLVSCLEQHEQTVRAPETHDAAIALGHDR
jgi:AcrR family transcriptional regulator